MARRGLWSLTTAVTDAIAASGTGILTCSTIGGARASLKKRRIRSYSQRWPNACWALVLLRAHETNNSPHDSVKLGGGGARVRCGNRLSSSVDCGVRWCARAAADALFRRGFRSD
ncbi:hypothetical protein EVAR_81086_1 [Eumeta japonica]|uniref:Uncharacterized protein n=1 Tax=Eumeta variegata TaxID=151549 RepID=A0A4C1T6J7_EUMVA|nr:hypothetical protein EVAR_81086_1 [Eumeta japonica]